MAGLTNICNVHGYLINDGERIADEGRLTYRGIDVRDIVNGCLADGHFGFEEVVWLLLFGKLPTQAELDTLCDLLYEYRELPEYFAEDMIIKAPSKNIMNKLARSVLALYSYDDNPDDTSLSNCVRQSLQLIARMPTIMTYAYQVKRRHFDKKSMYFHPINPEYRTAQSILNAIRPNKKFTEDEARLLDLCLIVHAEHGGGNNSTFSCRVLSSSGTDTYSAVSAAIGSLKGPKHGGANHRVMMMMDDLMANVKDWENEDEVAAYLVRILRREVGDHSGLIYGMGHAVYTKSDPRAVILKEQASKIVAQHGMERGIPPVCWWSGSLRRSCGGARKHKKKSVRTWTFIPGWFIGCSGFRTICLRRCLQLQEYRDGVRTVLRKSPQTDGLCVRHTVRFRRVKNTCQFRKGKGCRYQKAVDFVFRFTLPACTVSVRTADFMDRGGYRVFDRLASFQKHPVWGLLLALLLLFL